MPIAVPAAAPGGARRGRRAGGARPVQPGAFAHPRRPPLPAELALFARIAPLPDGSYGFAGAITPLDEAAFAVARDHLCAGARSAAAAARWAEAVYCHVVRHGTLDFPGVNRPPDDDLEDDVADDPETAELRALAEAWAELRDGAPADAALLQRTRQRADLMTILEALVLAAVAPRLADSRIAAGLERMLLVQLETVLLRERSGSGRLTLAGIAAALDREIAERDMPAAARDLFEKLRLRLSGGGGRAQDRELERLVQRIQGLRAKTVAQGCTEQEAMAAAEKVAELLDRYGLTLGELELREQPCEGIGIQTGRRRFGPIDTCVPMIATFFDCRVWVEQAKGEPLRYVFFGLRGDVAAAQYLYELVERAFETETAAFRGGVLYAEMPSGERRTATTSFQTGLAHGICGKLKALREAREAMLRSNSGRDLVPVKASLVEDELAKLGLDLHQRHAARSKRVLTDAFEAGHEAGQRFEYTPGITQAA